MTQKSTTCTLHCVVVDKRYLGGGRVDAVGHVYRGLRPDLLRGGHAVSHDRRLDLVVAVVQDLIGLGRGGSDEVHGARHDGEEVVDGVDSLVRLGRLSRRRRGLRRRRWRRRTLLSGGVLGLVVHLLEVLLKDSVDGLQDAVSALRLARGLVRSF